MSLPKWVQEAFGKGQELSVCIELCRHATVVEIDVCAVRRDEKKVAKSSHGESYWRLNMEEEILQAKMRELD